MYGADFWLRKYNGFFPGPGSTLPLSFMEIAVCFQPDKQTALKT